MKKILDNTIMFTSENHCSGCKNMKNLFEREKIEPAEIIDIDNPVNMLIANQYRIRSLPTFVNTSKKIKWAGTLPINLLQEFNEGEGKLPYERL